MTAIYPWFYTSLLKYARPQPGGLSALKDNFYKVKATLQINKQGKHSKVKWMGYDLSYNQ